jgi:ribosomal protein L33
MTVVRQLPVLPLRGSIANITMANLTQEQQQHMASIFAKVRDSSVLQSNKIQAMKSLGVTIKSDYVDKQAAEQEFNIAIWRGIVNILYHRDYTFQCSHCESSTYLTQRGKPKAIDRLQVPCPNCKMAKVKDSGCSDYVVGQVINHAEAQERFKYVASNTPTFQSTIEYVAGDRKYPDPYKILNDEDQLKKFFSEFIWNYFRQQIKENKRVSNKSSVQLTGPADHMVLELIIDLCKRSSVEHFCDKVPMNGTYKITASILQTSPEFTVELAAIILYANQHDVQVLVEKSQIIIITNYSAPTITVSVTKSEHINVLEDQETQEDGEATGFSVSQVDHRTIGGYRMDQEDHISVIDLKDASEKTRRSLPDNECRKIFDIYMQTGIEYDAYCNLFADDRVPKIKNLAKMLNITTCAVKQHRETIKIHCMLHDFVPERQ